MDFIIILFIILYFIVQLNIYIKNEYNSTNYYAAIIVQAFQILSVDTWKKIKNIRKDIISFNIFKWHSI